MKESVNVEVFWDKENSITFWNIPHKHLGGFITCLYLTNSVIHKIGIW